MSFLKKRIVLLIFIVPLLCNAIIPLYLHMNSQKNMDIATIPAIPSSLITRDGEVYTYEDQNFTSFTFSGNATYLFTNCTFDCDDLNFGPLVKVAFLNCTILTKGFHTSTFQRVNVPTNYSAEINVTQCDITFKPAPLMDMLKHTDFVFLGTSVVRIENTTIYAPLRQLEPHEDTKIFFRNTFLGLHSIQIFERASVVFENSIINSTSTVVGDIYDITPPHNTSLFLNNSRLSGLIWNFGLNSTVTLQNSTAEFLVRTIWVEGSVALKDSAIVNGSSYAIADYDIDANSSWQGSQYLIIGLQSARIQIESSTIYALMCNESFAALTNSFVTDFISGVGEKTQIFAKNSVLTGKGSNGQTFGVVSPYHAGAVFYKWTNAPQSTFYSLINCTINGTILLWTETVILQNCQYPLGEWNDTVIASSNQFIVAVIESQASQYLTGNTSIEIFGGSAYQIEKTNLSINAELLNTPQILTRPMNFYNIFGGNYSFIETYVRYTFDFTVCGRVNFSIIFTDGYEIYNKNFTLDASGPWCMPSVIGSELSVLLSFCALVGLLFVAALRRRISRDGQ